MKVFLSWSGQRSHKVACAFRDWLPSVIQSVIPYVSSEDIDKGARWSTDIAKELEASNYGMICVTKKNASAPWINFEAGALSKSLDKANVAPFLIDIKRSDVQGPLLQFQSVIFEKGELSKLVASINNRIAEKSRLTDSLLEKAFNVWWPHLEAQLKELEKSVEPPKPAAPADDKTKILEELLELARQQQRILNSPDTLLPPGYLEFVFERMAERGPGRDIRIRREREYDSLHEKARHLDRLLSSIPAGSSEIAEAARLADRLHDQLHSLRGNPRRRLRVADRIMEEDKKE